MRRCPRRHVVRPHTRNRSAKPTWPAPVRLALSLRVARPEQHLETGSSILRVSFVNCDRCHGGAGHRLRRGGCSAALEYPKKTAVTPLVREVSGAQPDSNCRFGHPEVGADFLACGTRAPSLARMYHDHGWSRVPSTGNHLEHCRVHRPAAQKHGTLLVFGATGKETKVLKRKSRGRFRL